MALRSHLKLMQGTMLQTKVQVEMIIQVDYEQITLGHIDKTLTKNYLNLKIIFF